MSGQQSELKRQKQRTTFLRKSPDTICRLAFGGSDPGDIDDLYGFLFFVETFFPSGMRATKPSRENNINSETITPQQQQQQEQVSGVRLIGQPFGPQIQEYCKISVILLL